MDLFVINRYKDDEENVDLLTQENKHLRQLKQKIEERKKSLAKINSDVIILKQEVSNETIKPHIVKIPLDVNETEADTSVLENNKANSTKNIQEFQVLGTSDFVKKEKVKRVLPYWLSHPQLVSTVLKNLTCAIKDLNWIDDSIRKMLLSDGMTHLFPVQEQVVPYVLREHGKPYPLRPRDICVSAPTGSGKTLSFVLPLIQILKNEMNCHIRALVVLPVQELAMQVTNVFKKYCGRSGLKVAALTGSIPLRQEQQLIIKYTEAGGWVSAVDIVVCTAGRLVEHLRSTPGFSLTRLQFLVIDEADRIMDHIQNDWLYHLQKHIKLENDLMAVKNHNLNWKSLSESRPPPQKLLFSATLSQDPEKLEQWGLFQPVLFSSAAMNALEHEADIRKFTTPAELKEEFITCAQDEKPLVLFHLLVEQKWERVLCFTNSAQSAHRLALLLRVWAAGRLAVAELSAALDAPTRELVLKKFTKSEINVLVTTDALARGIDVPACGVVSYDAPRDVAAHVHRAGRAARAGREGRALVLLAHAQLAPFKELLSRGESRAAPAAVPADACRRLAPGYRAALRQVKAIIHSEIHSKVHKSIELKRGKNKTKRKLDDIQ